MGAKTLITYNSIPAKLYCLPKVHKPNTYTFTANWKFYQFDHLQHLQISYSDTSISLFDDTAYTIKDTFSFVNTIRGKTLLHHVILVSLDVMSLFTNVPVK